jgi:hypothetical protein
VALEDARRLIAEPPREYRRIFIAQLAGDFGMATGIVAGSWRPGRAARLHPGTGEG